MDDASALLARFAPGPGRTGRVVLHPRLTIVPLQRDDFAGLQASFATDIDVHVVTVADVAAGASVVERIAAYDEAIENIESLLARHQDAIAAVSTAETRLHDARTELDRVAAQRARADEAINTAGERLALLEGAASPESDVRRELEAAREAAAAAAVEHEIALAMVAHPANQPRPTPALDVAPSADEVAAAERTLAGAKAALARIESQPTEGAYALDAASKQLQMWAAQRAVDVARHDLERLQARTPAPEPAPAVNPVQERIEAAAHALAKTRARVEAAERALRDRAQTERSNDPTAEADALRTQIEAVRESLTAADEQRSKEVAEAQHALDEARREAAVAERRLAVAIDRFESGADVRDAAGVLARVRTRRVALDQLDATSTDALLRMCVQETTAPIVVLLEPFVPEPPDLVDAVVTLSESKRIVLVTSDERAIETSRLLDPEIGAVRTALVTGVAEPAFAQRNGNLP